MSCAYPGCEQLTAAPGSDRGAKPKYCDNPDHNPLSAHRERRRDAESERDTARADREQANDAAAQAAARMEQLERQLAELQTSTEAEVRRTCESAPRKSGRLGKARTATSSAARADAARQVADAENRAETAGQDAARAEHAQAAAAAEIVRIREDYQHALDQLTTATSARIAAWRKPATLTAPAPTGPKQTSTPLAPETAASPNSSLKPSTKPKPIRK